MLGAGWSVLRGDAPLRADPLADFRPFPMCPLGQLCAALLEGGAVFRYEV